LGLLRHPDRWTPLAAEHRVGRSASCDLRVHHPAVSGEHAILRWTAAGWDVRDLGSRNGTAVDGRRLAPGCWTPATRGAAITFGTPEQRWELVDDGPPSLMAIPEDAGAEAVVAVADLLALPSLDQPEVVIARGAAGWTAERGEELRPLAHRDRVEVGGALYRIYLPEEAPMATASVGASPSLADGALHFRVSRDEEHVELCVELAGRTWELGARASHYPLLLLARARRADAGDPGRPASGQGWVHVDALVRMLRTEDRLLNVMLFRARRHFAEVGVPNAGALIERRVGARQLRIGVARLTETPLG
jgi:hypothetical protein